MKLSNLKALGTAVTAALALSACTTVEKPPIDEPKKPLVKETKVSFEEKTFADLPASSAESWEAALLSFRHSCSAAMGQDAKWANACRQAEETPVASAQDFFYRAFTPWQIRIDEIGDGELLSSRTTGLMTGYYEPLLHGSRTKTGPYVHPIYGIPDDLLVIDLADTYPQLKGLRLRGKLEGRRVVPYDTRGVIQERTDMDRWALAWVDDPIASFFLQVQGSGRIRLTDGTYLRVGYGDQNGYRYRSIGNWLIKKGYLKSHELSMQRITAWAKQNPSRVKEALAQNPSYIFFAERTSPPELGPVGAQGVPLTPQASVAVDPRYWRMGTPFIVNVEQKRPDLAFARPVIAQDTGGAIKGVIRFDYFWGFGDEAGAMAGRQKSRAAAWVLVPNGLLPEDITRIR